MFVIIAVNLLPHFFINLLIFKILNKISTYNSILIRTMSIRLVLFIFLKKISLFYHIIYNTKSFKQNPFMRIKLLNG